MIARVKWLLKLAVGFAVVAYLFRESNGAEVLNVMARANSVLMFLAFGLYLLSQLISALRWQLIGRKLGFENPTTDFVIIYFIGMFFNLLSPSLVAGDIGRGFYLANEVQGRARAFQSVIADRFIGFLALVTFAGLALLFSPHWHVFPRSLQYGVFVLAAAGYVAWWALPKVSAALPLGKALRHVVEENMSAVWQNHPLLWKTFLLSLLINVVQVLTMFILSVSAEVNVPFSYFLISTPLVNAVSSLPVSVSGIGLREGGYIFFLGMLGVTREDALGLSLLWLAIVVFSALWGGACFAFFDRSKNRECRP